MSFLLQFLGSSAFGTILGSLFGWLNRREENKDKQNLRLHEQTMQKMQFDQQVTLAEKKIQEVAEVGKQTVLQEEAKAFTESQKVVNGFSEILKSWARLIFTTVLLYQCIKISNDISRLVGGLESLPMDYLTEEYKFVIGEFFCLCGTALGWFFAARGMASSKRTK